MTNQEEPETGNGGTPGGAVEFSMDFKPETVADIIKFATWMRAGEQGSIIESRWTLGDRINQLNESVYGEDTIGRIAAESGYSTSTIHKCKKFAEKYSSEQKASLLNGSFILSWRDIALNLSVEPEKFIAAYEESTDREKFRNAVTKLKPTKKQLEADNTELRNRVSELVAENSKLKAQIQALNEKQEVPEE